jgi:hypothetical protein
MNAARPCVSGPSRLASVTKAGNDAGRENEKETIMTTENASKPVEKVQVGQVKIAVFRNTNDKGTYYTSKLEHQYKSGDTWKPTNNYGQRELIHLAKAALLAESAILKLKAADRKAAGETGGDDAE